MQKHAWRSYVKLSCQLLPEYFSPRVSVRLSMTGLPVFLSRVFTAPPAAASEFQAATSFLPSLLCPVRQLHHVFKPGSPLLQRQWSICLPLRQLHSTETPRSAAVKGATASKAVKVQAATVNASDVKASFAEAGFPQGAIDHILTRYPSYLRWNVEQKLLPAIQSWQQELGANFLSEVERVPTLLLEKPAEELLKNKYLASIGIKSPERIRKRSPYVLHQSLTSVQSKVAFLQQWGFTTAQTLSLIEKHPDALNRTSEHLGELFTLVEDMFDCADREMLCDVMLSCRFIRLGPTPARTLHCNFTYFCTCVEVNDKQKKRAWTQSVFTVPPAELNLRLSSVAAQLSVTLDEAKAVFRSAPQLTTRLPETVGLHVTQLLDLGFSHDQVKSMCLRQPVLLAYSWSSDVRLAKWGFLTRVLRLGNDAIADKPCLLRLSLPNRIGPRWEYLQQLKLHGEIIFTPFLGSVMCLNDDKFRAVYIRPQLRVYDQHYQKEWQQRWKFLLVDQQLSIQDIADDPDLLQVPLKARIPDISLPDSTDCNV